MEVHCSTDLHTKLNRVAPENSTDADGYIQQLIEHYVDHDAWFLQKVKKGLEQLDRGEYFTHEEVEERIERMFRREMDVRRSSACDDITGVKSR